MYRGAKSASFTCSSCLALALAVFLIPGSCKTYGQQGGGGGFGGGGFGGFGQAVGGISINTDGVVRNIHPEALQDLVTSRRKALEKDPGFEDAGVRRVSLAGLISAINGAKGGPLPIDIIFLSGLQRITEIHVVPESKDIILSGPAEEVTVDARGNIVGVQSGRPALRLEDFVEAYRAIDGARSGGMQCSIDPTEEGLRKLQAFFQNQRGLQSNPDAMLRGMEEALGPQVIRVSGVSDDSRFAQVLLAADYRMKRIGMGLESSGVREIPSYLAMVPAGRSASALPRFWLEPMYEPLSHDPDELSWRINGRTMTCLSESDLLAKNGIERGQGAVDGISKKWCATMTEHYEELSRQYPVFAELVNCVDLAVVAALIHGRQLDQRSGLSLEPLLNQSSVPLPSYPVAKTVPTVATKLRKGRGWVVSASGGVQFQPWAYAVDVDESVDLVDSRLDVLKSRQDNKWFW